MKKPLTFFIGFLLSSACIAPLGAMEEENEISLPDNHNRLRNLSIERAKERIKSKSLSQILQAGSPSSPSPCDEKKETQKTLRERQAIAGLLIKNPYLSNEDLKKQGFGPHLIKMGRKYFTRISRDALKLVAGQPVDEFKIKKLQKDCYQQACILKVNVKKMLCAMRHIENYDSKIYVPSLEVPGAAIEIAKEIRKHAKKIDCGMDFILGNPHLTTAAKLEITKLKEAQKLRNKQDPIFLQQELFFKREQEKRKEGSGCIKCCGCCEWIFFALKNCFFEG